MERDYGARQTHVRQALVKTVKEIRTRGETAGQQPASGIGRQRLPPGSQIPVRPIGEIEAGLGVRGRQAKQQGAGIDTYARKLVAEAIGCVNPDGHSILYSFILR